MHGRTRESRREDQVSTVQAKSHPIFHALKHEGQTLELGFENTKVQKSKRVSKFRVVVDTRLSNPSSSRVVSTLRGVATADSRRRFSFWLLRVLYSVRSERAGLYAAQGTIVRKAV